MADSVDTSKTTHQDSSGAASLMQTQTRSAIEQQRQQARQQAENSLDRDAISAIEETRNALDAIAASRVNDALAAIERATGKINVLLARNADTALIPVSVEIVVFDTAPEDLDEIADIADAAEAAIAVGDYPASRALLYGLMSEIRVRTYNLPLATYPTALSTAARLLDQKKSDDAATVLQAALNTLVAIDEATPIPLLLVREAVAEAQSRRDQDRDTALALLDAARHELARATELGYAAQDPEYKGLIDDISNLEKELKRKGDTTSLFSHLRERLSGFIKRLSGGKPSRQAKSDEKKSAEPERQRPAA